MRDLLVLGAMFFLVPFALRSPFVAYLIWGWTGLIAIDEYLYGFMAGMRFNLIFALITLCVLLLNANKLEGRWSANRTTILLMLWLLQGTLSAVFAYPGVNQNWELYEKFIKILLFVLLMPLVVVRRHHMHAMILVVCLGLSFHGLLEGLKVIATGGGHIVRGLFKFGDNNHFAVIIVMAIPLLHYAYLQLSNRFLRLGAVMSIVLVVAAVIGTHSRGGLLSLGAAFAWVVLSGKRKFMSFAIVSLGIVAVSAFAPENWLGRMNTIKEAGQDSSFMQRVEAWQVSSAIALQNPLLGGGFHAVQNQAVWQKYRGDTGLLGFAPTFSTPSPVYRAAHSIYFEVLGDFGFVGFFLFVTILGNILVTCVQTRRLVAKSKADLGWALQMSNALAAVALGFIVGGGGVSLAYSETIFVVAMLAEILKQHVAGSVQR